MHKYLTNSLGFQVSGTTSNTNLMYFSRPLIHKPVVSLVDGLLFSTAKFYANRLPLDVPASVLQYFGTQKH
jgi:hypothetical protein